MKDVNLLINNGVDVEESIREIFGDIEAYNDIAKVFLSEAGGKIIELKSYLEKADMENYGINVHSFKTSVKYVGAKKLAELAFNHEMASRANNIGYVTEHFDELVTEANRIINLMKQYLGVSDTMTSTVSQQPKEEATIIPFPGNTVTSTISQSPREEATVIPFTTPVIKDETILVADDAELVRSYVSRIFAGEYNVLGAKDGKEAIDIIHANVDDKIVGMLLDLNMPNVDGFQVLEYLKQENLFAKIPVAIITGDILKSSIDRACNYPIRTMLQKPFNEVNVKNAVNQLIMFHNEYKNSNQEETVERGRIAA